MDRFRALIRTSLLGGIVVVLPTVLLIIIFNWLFDIVTDLIQPFTNLVRDNYQLPEFFADVVVMAIILVSCFVIGVTVKTKVGNFIHQSLENKILRIAPGYTMIKETVMHLFGGKQSPFSSVALVRIFNNDTLMTAFVTDRTDHSVTVFVPTGPNPTSGLIYHLKPENVYPVDVPVEVAMR
ncbi:MAG: DUF502 domain-containing protein, partial [Calditrichota bacterium]